MGVCYFTHDLSPVDSSADLMSFISSSYSLSHFRSSVTVTRDEVGNMTIKNHSPVTSNSFNRKSMYSLNSVCLAAGCFEASLVLSSDTKPSTAMSIPSCGIFLAPLRTKQVFCIEPSKPVKDDVTGKVVSLFSADACYSLCERGPHVLLDAFLFEEQGGGWMGGYYAITPLNHSVPVGFNGFNKPVRQPTVSHVNAASAGTLEWSFSSNRSVCIPLGDYGDSTVPSPHTHPYHQSESLSSELKFDFESEFNVETTLEAKKEHLAHAPVCHSIQLSIPTLVLPVFPVFFFQNAWNIPKGKHYASEGRLTLTA